MAKQTSRLSRRSFLTKTVAGAATGAVALTHIDAFGRVLGANDKIRVVVAGINGRGRSHIRHLGSIPNVELVYLADPDSSIFESRQKLAHEHGGNTPTCVQDVRQALDDKNVDVLSVATCNHWHSLLTIWGCQAGKDVYVEKPLSHNVHEGRVAVEMARTHNRIVQHGTQQRANDGRAQEIAAVQSGKYGKLLVSKGYCCKPRWSIGTKPTGNPPAHLDFNLWLGPASAQPYHGNLVHYKWHWFWQTGNGDIGNQGVHEMDVARWAIKGATLPTRVWSLGGRFAYEDQGETPNTQMAVYEYGDTLLVFEVRGLVGEPSKDARKVANEYYLEEGMITGGKFYPKNGGTPETVVDVPGSDSQLVFNNFIDAVRTRKTSDLRADVLEGHYSSALCHLANISYRLGEVVPFNKKTKAFGDNKVVHDTFKALENNLGDGGVGLKLDGLQYRLGRTLDVDPARERCVGDAAANSMLTREYRAPFVVPQVS